MVIIVDFDALKIVKQEFIDNGYITMFILLRNKTCYEIIFS